MQSKGFTYIRMFPSFLTYSLLILGLRNEQVLMSSKSLWIRSRLQSCINIQAYSFQNLYISTYTVLFHRSTVDSKQKCLIFPDWSDRLVDLVYDCVRFLHCTADWRNVQLSQRPNLGSSCRIPESPVIMLLFARFLNYHDDPVPKIISLALSELNNDENYARTNIFFNKCRHFSVS